MTRCCGLVFVVLLMVVLVGCGRGIPPGAQQVQITVTDSELRLDPATVQAGAIYLVLELPGSGVLFVQRGAPDGSGPLSDDDVARLALGGDTQGFYMEILSDPGCPDDRGGMGPPCGNVHHMVLDAGRYAFVRGGIEHGPPRSMAVLEVLP